VDGAHAHGHPLRVRERAHWAAFAWSAIGLLAATGCSLDSGGERTVDAGLDSGSATDSGSGDAGGRPDAFTLDAFVPDGCVATPEVCNSLDDDCNGVPDDGFDLMTDATNCGMCGLVCGTGLACVSGRCVGNVLDVAAGEEFTCALRRDGRVLCWGANDQGQLGSGVSGPASGAPMTVPGITNATEITAGRKFACAVLSDSTVTCWGENAAAELGRGTTMSPGPPGMVGGLTRVRHVTAGFAHACALLRGPPELWCWGSNEQGQVGESATGVPNPHPSTMPARVATLAGEPGAVAAGGDDTCVTISDVLYCWGRDNEGELGIGGVGASAAPVRPALPSGSVLTFSVGNQTSCALTDLLSCWGRNDHGQVGDGSTMQRTLPALVSTSITDFTQLAVGYDNTCGRQRGGGVACWGTNGEGQLALGAVGGMDATVPSIVTTIGGVARVTVGRAHVCALTTTGSVQCWGSGSQGQIGRMGPPAAMPLLVAIPPP